eukprot:gene3645-4826_t
MRLMSSDNIDFPVVIEPATYAWAALIVLAAGVVSALLVRRQIDRLDLVAVLKLPALRRWAPWALAALAVVALTWWAFQPRPLLVEVAPVTTGRFEQAIEEDGQLRLKHRYLISAPTQAELARPTLKVGDAVRAGDVVATLTPVAPQMIDARTRLVLQQRVGSADAARRASSAQLQRLDTALAQASLEAERSQKLARENFIAPSALDQAVLARRS